MVFRVRELLIRQRTQAINSAQGHLMNFGRIVLQGAANASRLTAIVEGTQSGLPAGAKPTLKVLTAALGHAATANQIVACRYQRAKMRDALAQLYEERGGLPSALFINSIGCFEGAVEFLIQLPMNEVDECRFGSFDYDPFGSLLRQTTIPTYRQKHGTK